MYKQSFVMAMVFLDVNMWQRYRKNKKHCLSVKSLCIFVTRFSNPLIKYDGK